MAGSGQGESCPPPNLAETKMNEIVNWLNTGIGVTYSIVFLTFFVGVAVGVVISENRRR